MRERITVRPDPEHEPELWRAYWQQCIEDAQLLPMYFIGNKGYARIPYGEEDADWGADSRPCHDCAVVKGQLHVSSCDVERCPKCHGQAISCRCDYADGQAITEAQAVSVELLRQSGFR